MYRCDECGYTDEQQDQNMATEIHHCGVCDKDFCEHCAEEHAKDETGLLWR